MTISIEWPEIRIASAPITLFTNTTEAINLDQRHIETTSENKPISWHVEDQVKKGVWRKEILSADTVGLSRDVVVFRAARKTNLIAYDWHGDKNTFCPPMWWDLAIGSGACGLGCRACFLMLTHRIKRDPLRHLLYDNLVDFVKAAEKWLTRPDRRRQHTLGVGIDRSDSLLYEGVAPHVRNLAPLFGNPKHNRLNNKLVLLTKTANTHFLSDIKPEHRQNIIVSFSLNPESIADLWEGKWPDTMERITPSIDRRLDAAKYAQDLGFEVRMRVDPILTPPEWAEQYVDFINAVKQRGVDFRYWTLGTYREKNTQLDAWRERWGLPPMEWQPEEDQLEKDGTHRHMAVKQRVEIYRRMVALIRNCFPEARISLCKETHSVRKAVSLCNADCNCLI